MSLCLEFSNTADLSNPGLVARRYFLKGSLHQKETSSHINIPLAYKSIHIHVVLGLKGYTNSIFNILSITYNQIAGFDPGEGRCTTIVHYNQRAD